MTRRNWCWAAVAAAVGNHLRTHPTGAPWEQCRIADLCLGRATCCTSNLPADDVMLDLPDALKQVHCDPGWVHEDPNKPPQLERIGLHLARGFPVCVRILWAPPKDAHFVVIVGCDVGNRTIDVFDPSDGDVVTDVSFRYFPTAFAGKSGSWTDTYYTVPLAGPNAPPGGPGSGIGT